MIANFVPFSEFCNKITLSFSSVQTLPVFFTLLISGNQQAGQKQSQNIKPPLPVGKLIFVNSLQLKKRQCNFVLDL